MEDQDQTELRLKVANLEIEHEDYARAIDAMIEVGVNTLTIQRFKKKKLALKDKITELHSRIIPNIIA